MLSDVNKDGRLSVDEYCVAMHLIDMKNVSRFYRVFEWIFFCDDPSFAHMVFICENALPGARSAVYYDLCCFSKALLYLGVKKFIVEIFFAFLL